MNNEEMQRQQMDQNRRILEEAQSVPNADNERVKARLIAALSETQQASDDNLDGISEFPLEFRPRVTVVIKAIRDEMSNLLCNIKAHKAGDGKVYDLINPLRPQREGKEVIGIARDGFTNALGFVASLAKTNYLVVAGDDEVATSVIGKTANRMFDRLEEVFYNGQRILEEEDDAGYSIDLSELFNFTVDASYNSRYSSDSATVNEVDLDVKVYMYAPVILESDNAERNISAYLKFLNNRSTDTMQVGMAIAFDPCNFMVCPKTLQLFNTLLGDSASVKASKVENENGNIVLTVQSNK